MKENVLERMERIDAKRKIADVTIMLEQLRGIYGLNDAVCDHMDAKILRLQSRVGGAL